MINATSFGVKYKPINEILHIRIFMLKMPLEEALIDLYKFHNISIVEISDMYFDAMRRYLRLDQSLFFYQPITFRFHQNNINLIKYSKSVLKSLST